MIICDVMMPEMDGYAFVDHVRKDDRTSWIPVPFLSAKGQSQDRVKGLNTGADVYMVKPFEPEGSSGSFSPGIPPTEATQANGDNEGQKSGSLRCT